MVVVVIALPSGLFELRQIEVENQRPTCAFCHGKTVTGGTFASDFRVFTQDHEDNCPSPTSVFSLAFLHEDNYRGDIGFLKCRQGAYFDCDLDDLATVTALVHDYMEKTNREVAQ
jgi:hypothetical protein